MTENEEIKNVCLCLMFHRSMANYFHPKVMNNVYFKQAIKGCRFFFVYLCRVLNATQRYTRKNRHPLFYFSLDHGTPEDPGSVLNFLHDVNIKQESFGKITANLYYVLLFLLQTLLDLSLFIALLELAEQEPS